MSNDSLQAAAHLSIRRFRRWHSGSKLACHSLYPVTLNITVKQSHRAKPTWNNMKDPIEMGATTLPCYTFPHATSLFSFPDSQGSGDEARNNRKIFSHIIYTPCLKSQDTAIIFTRLTGTSNHGMNQWANAVLPN